MILKPKELCNHCMRRPWVVKFRNMFCCAGCYITVVTLQQDERAMSREPSFEHEVTRNDTNRSDR